MGDVLGEVFLELPDLFGDDGEMPFVIRPSIILPTRFPWPRVTLGETDRLPPRRRRPSLRGGRGRRDRIHSIHDLVAIDGPSVKGDGGGVSVIDDYPGIASSLEMSCLHLQP